MGTVNGSQNLVKPKPCEDGLVEVSRSFGDTYNMATCPKCEGRGCKAKPRLLDLFCGAGGAGMGYYRAGFQVTGVDIAPQPNYPKELNFVCADALMLDMEYLESFDVIHASPPCQKWVGWQNIGKARGGKNDHLDLIAPTRALLQQVGRPWVIENGTNAPVVGITLCGSSFGLNVVRHRTFESSELLLQPSACLHSGLELAVYGKLDGRRVYTRADGSEQRNPDSLEAAQAGMGIDWMAWDELREAIPPAYTEFIGRQLIRAVCPGAHSTVAEHEACPAFQAVI